jgi:anti-sigma B factor antagonist
MDLFVHTGRLHAATVVRLAGSLTAATASILETALVEPLSSRAARVVVDLSGITNCDHSGVAALAGTAVVAGDRGGELRIAAPSVAVCAWLRVGGLITRVPTFVTVAGAVRADLVDLISPLRQLLSPWTSPAVHAVAATRRSSAHRRARARTRPRSSHPNR